MIGFDLWDGTRKLAEERRREGLNAGTRGRAHRKRKAVDTPR